MGGGLGFELGDALENTEHAGAGEGCAGLVDVGELVGELFELLGCDERVELIDAELVLEADVECGEGLDDEVVDDVWCELCVFHVRKVRGVAWGSRKKFGSARILRTDAVSAREIFGGGGVTTEGTEHKEKRCRRGVPLLRLPRAIAGEFGPARSPARCGFIGL